MADANIAAMPLAARQRVIAGLLLLGLIAANLRPFLTSVGPVLEQLRADTGLGFRAAALLTALPFVLMGVLAFAGARLAASVGERHTVALALLLLCGGCAARWWVQDSSGLIASAALAGAGVAAIQALMPGVAKRLLPRHVGLAMGVYSAALVGGGALGALFSPWLAVQGGWHLALSVWLWPALLALLLWLQQAPQHSAAEDNPWQGSVTACARNRRAWQLALYFGLTNSGYSSLVAWLPSFYRELGASTQLAANLLAALAAVQALAALALPLLARRQGDQRPLLWLALLAQAVGFAGLYWAPLAAPWLWVMLAGAGLGGFFSLCLLLVLEHLPDAARAGRLAAFVQGCGFLLTAGGPWLMGWWRERGGQFGGGWAWQLGIVLAMLLLTTWFSPASYPRAMRGV